MAYRTFIVDYPFVAAIVASVYRMVDGTVADAFVMHYFYDLGNGPYILLRFTVQFYICDMPSACDGMERSFTFDFLYNADRLFYMEQYLEEKKASQKRPAATFQRHDKRKAVYQAPQRPVTTSSAQVPSLRSPGVKKECPHCGKTHGGTECWMVAGKCLKCGSNDHKIKDCPRLQQGV